MTKKDYSCSENSIKYTVYPNTIHDLNTSPTALLSKSVILRKWQRKLENRTAKKLETKRLAIFNDRDIAIVDSGASGWYFTPDAPVSNVNPHAAKI